MALGGGAAAAIAASALLIGGGAKGSSGVAGRPPSARPLKLTLVHGRAFIGGKPAPMGVAPSLQAGNVGVCMTVVDDGGLQRPAPQRQLSRVRRRRRVSAPRKRWAAAGEIDAIFTGPGVAAMRVAHVGTFKAERRPDCHRGARQIVFYRPPGSRGTVIPPGSLHRRFRAPSWPSEAPI